MKTADERTKIVLARVEKIESSSRRRGKRAPAILGVLTSVCIIVAVSLAVASKLAESDAKPQAGGVPLLAGSFLADGDMMGYVFVALLGVVLGAGLVLLVRRAEEMRYAERRPDMSPKTDGLSTTTHKRADRDGDEP